LGAFAIIRRDKRRRREAVVDKLRASFAAQGFAEPKVFETEFALILLYPKLVTGQLNAAADTTGDFAFYTGTLVRDGTTGDSALNHLLSHPPERYTGLAGAYALVVNNGRGLRLMLDPLGAYKVYTDAEKIVWSSSFLAVLSTIEGPQIDPQGVYEYVFNGATFGKSTVVRQISMIEPGLHKIGRVATFQANALPEISKPMSEPRKVLIDKNLKLLRERFGSVARAFGTNIDMALTGGYDSRLMLALIREAGITPRLHVYGAPGDPDVEIAQLIAAGEGLPLIHTNKEQARDMASPDELAQIVKDQFLAFDGCPPDGIFGNGTDLATRRARCETGRLALNGGCGEIYRNFFYLPDRGFTTRELLWSFWSQFDPATCTSGFREGDYLAALEKKMLAVLETSSRQLTRPQVEYLYPAFRGRFWTSLNTCVNLRFGDAATPFLDEGLARAAAQVPVKFKNYGQFEAALITAIDPKLAAYPSAYGHSFAAPPSRAHRLSEWSSIMRPPLLRRLTFRLRNMTSKAPLPWYLTENSTKDLLPGGLHYMPGLFKPGRIHDSGQMNRLLTLEYLFQSVGAR
jgi:asparagine synthase (glutamine-hydrolysing)